MTDERCHGPQHSIPAGLSAEETQAAIARSGDITAAIDEERSRRVVLATLRGNLDAKFDIMEQIGDCPRCLRGVVGYLANWLDSELVLAEVDDDTDLQAATESVIATVERQLTDSMAKRMDPRPDA